VTDQSALKHSADQSQRLRSTNVRADWEVTIMLGDPKWCELFLILYRTPYSTKLKVNKTDVVTMCLFRIFTFEQFLPSTKSTKKDDICVRYNIT